MKLAEGTYGLRLTWADPYAKPLSWKVSIEPGRTTTIEAARTAWKIGDTGLAGGVIFLDKGNAGGGWRFLEAARG
ncbi:MAG: hypothetical protein NT080_07975 [Spirochaetes bacterium]|nr:hypothetical protein [Spirochaetota bacterium]